MVFPAHHKTGFLPSSWNAYFPLLGVLWSIRVHGFHTRPIPIRVGDQAGIHSPNYYDSVSHGKLTIHSSHFRHFSWYASVWPFSGVPAAKFYPTATCIAGTVKTTSWLSDFVERVFDQSFHLQDHIIKKRSPRDLVELTWKVALTKVNGSAKETRNLRKLTKQYPT